MTQWAIGNGPQGRAQGMGLRHSSHRRGTATAHSFGELLIARIISPAGLEELIVKHTRDEFHYQTFTITMELGTLPELKIPGKR